MLIISRYLVPVVGETNYKYSFMKRIEKKEIITREKKLGEKINWNGWILYFKCT